MPVVSDKLLEMFYSVISKQRSRATFRKEQVPDLPEHLFLHVDHSFVRIKV